MDRWDLDKPQQLGGLNSPVPRNDLVIFVYEDGIGKIKFPDRSPCGEGRLVGLVQLLRNSPYGQP